MSEKTPYQVMREIQKRVIEKQKLDAENRAVAFKYGITASNPTELAIKIKEFKEKEERLANERRLAAEEERKANARRRALNAEVRTKNTYMKHSGHYDQGYSGSTSSTSQGSYDSGSYGGGDCGGGSSSGGSCDF